MKIILIIPCVLYSHGVVDVVEAADKNLRGSNRDLFGQFDVGSVGGNDPNGPFATLISTAPVQPQPSPPSIFPGQPYQTPKDIAPVSGNNPLTSPTNPYFLQPTDPAGSFDFGSVFDGDFYFGNVSGLPSLSEDSQTGTGGDSGGDSLFPGGSGCPGQRLGVICAAVSDPVICGSCKYSNSCKAGGAGFAANQCRPAVDTIPGNGASDSYAFPNLPPGLGGGPGIDDSPGSSGCQKSEGACPAVFDPVICEGGCKFSNSCRAGGAGFAANQCRPD
jgi:hypothetical protein